MIFGTIAVARRLQDVVSNRFGGSRVFAWLVIGTVALVALWLTVRFAAAYGRKTWPRLAWLLGSGSVYVAYTLQLKSSPVEALHFLQYGVLGALLFHAFSHRIQDALLPAAAVTAGLLIGTLDEVIQWATPARYWDWRDVRLNGLSCALMQVAILGACRPRGFQWNITPASIRIFCRLAVAALLLFSLCFANTPKRVDVYTARLPVLRFLQNNPSVMAEYGYRHVDPELGTFFSRLSLPALRREDRERAPEAAPLLNRWRSHASYPDFLRKHPSHVDPFLHECRVHLFRVDHHLGRMREALPDHDKAHDHAEIAYREYRLVQAYFPETLKRSRFVRPDRDFAIANFVPATDPGFTSTVSRDLITSLSEKNIQATLTLLVVVMVGVDVIMGLRKHAAQNKD